MCETSGKTSSGTSDKTSDADGLSDEELLSLYQASGDETYFEIIYHRRKDGLRRFLLKFLHHQRHDQIDDLIQIVFAELYHLAPTIDRGKFSVGGWLLQCAECRARDLIRRSTASKRYTGTAESQIRESNKLSDEDPSDAVSRQEIADRVQSMVRCLPPEEQEAVLLTLEGLSRREGAAKLGITPGAFQGRLARGILALQIIPARRWRPP